ncbi:hypothetical protein MPER_03345, partial [Moniliophthora perniciosa FA553]
DNALPGSRWWKKINQNTLTPVNAVWLVMIISGICGVVGFSEAALSSLAGFMGLFYWWIGAIPIKSEPRGRKYE